MARFDVYPLGSGPGYVLDVQANLLRDLNTRMVVPLVARSQAPKPISRLNPIFRVMGEDFVMMTQWMAAVPITELQQPVARLTDQDVVVTAALDFLMAGI